MKSVHKSGTGELTYGSEGVAVVVKLPLYTRLLKKR